MEIKRIMIIMAVLSLMSCGKTAAPDATQEKGDGMEQIQQLVHNHRFRDALAKCDSMLENDTYRIDTMTTDENNRRYITIMRFRIQSLNYLKRQVEAVNDMKTLAEFCSNNTDDEENSNSSVAAQMDVKIGLAEIDMGKTENGFALIDEGINAMRDKTSKNARLATVNFMHDKAKALESQSKEDDAIALSFEALERMKQLREEYADSFAVNHDMDVKDFCEFYEGNFYAFLASVYKGKAERGVKEAADSVRYYFDQAMKVPHFREMRNSNTMLVGVYGFLNMQSEFERAYRQIEEEFAQDTLAYFYIDVQQYVAEMALKQGDNKRAIAIMNRVARLQSMRIKDDTMKHVAEAANAYEVAEIQRLQHETEVSRLKWIIMAVCLGFVALAVCIALFHYYRRNRRAYSRYNAIIATHDANEMVIRALKMDPNTPIDYLLTLTGEAQPEELERRFELVNGMSLNDFRMRLQQDEVNDDDAQDTTTETPEHDAFLAKLDKVLLSNDRLFADEISRKEIAWEMGMPMMHILQHLKEYTGCTLTAYITQKRLEHASHLLLTTQHKVEAVCYASGFSSVATFYRLFSKHYGCPPAEYRTSHSKKQAPPRWEEPC